MKIYDWHIAPNPRRLHMFLHEKQIKVDLVEVGGSDFQLTPEYKAQYPHAMVPMLELDDGTQIGEVIAICRFFDELNPDMPLFGKSAKERALITMWENRANEEGMLAASELFRNTHPQFADRGLPGAHEPIPQLEALRVRARARLARFFAKLQSQLSENKFLAGNQFSMADITAFCAVDFAKWSDLEPPAEYKDLHRWYQDVNDRPSSKA
jgi:glutathione S-transferase